MIRALATSPALRHLTARIRGTDYGRVTLFISAGRCGTQWLAATLESLYGDVAAVEHEPVGTAYRSGYLLRQAGQAQALREVGAVGSHIARIREALVERDYVETGAPLYGVVPFFLETFPAQVRLVHLVRHPVFSAASMATHDRFSRTGKEREWMEAAMLDPFREGVVQRGFADRWTSMSDYEKSLFFWTEVHLHAEELKGLYRDVPVHMVRFEDLTGGAPEPLEDLVRFIGLPVRAGLAQETSTRVDRWRLAAKEHVDWRSIHRHPEAVRLAALYGYDFDQLSDAQIDETYMTGRAVQAPG